MGILSLISAMLEVSPPEESHFKKSNKNKIKQVKYCLVTFMSSFSSSASVFFIACFISKGKCFHQYA